MIRCQKEGRFDSILCYTEIYTLANDNRYIKWLRKIHSVYLLYVIIFSTKSHTQMTVSELWRHYLLLVDSDVKYQSFST